MSDKLSPDSPHPRLCHVLKWPDFDGYGFNLHGEKSKPGQYIGKVDKSSPAEAAGLKANDRIIEVNGTNISNENHKQVVQRIKAIPNETKLLVVDEEADQFYRSKNIVVRGDLSTVLYNKTPVSSSKVNGNGETNGNNGAHHSDDDGMMSSHASDSGSGSLPSTLKKESRNGFRMEDDMSSSGGPSPVPMASSTTPSPVPMVTRIPSNNRSSGLDLNMTASEMRAKLAARKKDKMDPRSQKMDIRKKYEIIQKL